MQPQEPAPSVTEQPPDAQAAEAPSEQPQQDSPSWWQRLFRGRDDGSEAEASQESPAASAASQTFTLTQEELDRRVQAETDRREARRAEAARINERKRLRDEDPWAYAEQDREAERAAETDGQITNVFQGLAAQMDLHTLDPLTEALPPGEKDRILRIEGAGFGLEGRKLVVVETLKSLEKHWKAEGAKDAEARLRRNPAFRKQLLAEVRSGALLEPEYLPAGAATAAETSGGTVSNLLRNQLRSRRS